MDDVTPHECGPECEPTLTDVGRKILDGMQAELVEITDELIVPLARAWAEKFRQDKETFLFTEMVVKSIVAELEARMIIADVDLDGGL